MRSRPVWLILLAAVITIGGWTPSGTWAVSDRSPCAIDGVERIVAIGDVHGAFDAFVSILKAAGLIDAAEHWAGGRTHFVQTGDVLDRGPDSRKALDLLRRLEEEASRAGGRVYPLLGNHEVMRMLGDLRYVSEGEYAAFRTESSDDMRDRAARMAAEQAKAKARAAGHDFDEEAFTLQFKKDAPLGAIEMRLAFGREGEYGRRLRQHATLVRINGIVFLHGGISPATAPLGCAAINDTVRADLTTNLDATRATPLESLAARVDGPLWYRGLAQEPEATFAGIVESILSALDARAMVVGHTVAPGGTIATRFAGRVIQIDTGMLDGAFFQGGKPSALEIQNGAFTAVYADHREVLVPAAKTAMR